MTPRLRRLLGGAVVVVLAVGAVWGIRWWRAAPDRELADRFELAFDLLDAERDDWRIARKVTDRNVLCDGESATRYGQVADSRGLIFDPDKRSEVAEAFAVGFEEMGWTVGRFIPDESPITTSFKVEAIRDRDLVLAYFSTVGSMDVIVRLGTCENLEPGRTEILVDRFPPDP